MSAGQLSRRRFVAGSAATIAAATTGVRPAWARATVREERHRVVVIGSGFGGSITALRLTQAGVNVLMLERGKRWPVGQPGVFPRMKALDHRLSWMNTLPLGRRHLGILEYFDGDGISVIAPAAVGGGSVPYHGMTLRPRADHFARVMPGELDYEQFASTWYPRAEGMLRAAPMPADVLAHHRYRATRQFIAAVKRAGFPEAVPVPMTLDWDVVRRELRGELPQVFSRGDVLFGVNGPGKRSLDTSYLADAQATGRLDLRPQHQVTDISRDGAGRWVVNVEVLDTGGRVRERLKVTTDALFLGAGTMNTTKLLLRAQAAGAVTDLPDELGQWWGTNGDLILTAVLKSKTGTWQGGPANYATKDWDAPDGPVTMLFAAVPWPVEGNLLLVVGMFIPEGHGSVRFDGVRDKLRVSWPRTADARAISTARQRMRRLTNAAGAVAVFDSTRTTPSTFHQLGGAVIGKVCDAHGRVLGQRGLYVTDGSLIPGSTACANPSLTIAALAERNAASVVPQDVGSVF
jgi:cholesterol oxidase